MTIKETFLTNRNLSMNEAHQLDLSRYPFQNIYNPSAVLTKERNSRVFEIYKKLELQSMLWDDMYFTANTRKDYSDVNENTSTNRLEKPHKELDMV